MVTQTYSADTQPVNSLQVGVDVEVLNIAATEFVFRPKPMTMELDGDERTYVAGKIANQINILVAGYFELPQHRSHFVPTPNKGPAQIEIATTKAASFNEEVAKITEWNAQGVWACGNSTAMEIYHRYKQGDNYPEHGFVIARSFDGFRIRFRVDVTKDGNELCSLSIIDATSVKAGILRFDRSMTGEITAGSNHIDTSDVKTYFGPMFADFDFDLIMSDPDAAKKAYDYFMELFLNIEAQEL